MMIEKYANISLVGLCCLMLITRFEHFGSINTLPDASLAIFFFAGLYANSIRWLAVLLALALLIDYCAITYGGVNGYCFTPAYVFLLPAYSALWFAGNYCRSLQLFTTQGLTTISVLLIAAVSVAFTISNLGFYLFSGYFPTLPAIDYVATVAKYYPSYLLTTLLYSSTIVIIHALLRGLQQTATDNTHYPR